MTQTSNAKIPLEVDGEVIYLDPNSAEGKALQRIENPIKEDEWITVGEIGEEIDMEAIDKRIKQRGYKIQVPSKNSSSS
jgi:hypothetical protein